jgi:hypothetical protein
MSGETVRGRPGRRAAMRATVTALGLAICAGLSVPAAAQQYPPATQNIYIDGSIPVDALTRSRVDAYLIQQEQRDLEEAERREQIELHIYQDRAFGTYSHGRY